MLKIVLEKNTTPNSDKIPFFVYIELAPIRVAGFETQFHVPIYRQESEGQTTYTAEICGFQMRSDSPQEILAQSRRVAPTLVNLSRMPGYVFIARYAKRVFPVYATRQELIGLTTPGGPLIRQRDLARVRQDVTYYLNASHALGTLSQIEKLHVRAVDQRTLALVRPQFYLKKRSQPDAEREFWAPVFPAAGEPTNADAIYTDVDITTGKLSEERAGGHEVFRLQAQVAQALVTRQQLQYGHDLRIDRLLPGYWQEVEQFLDKQPAQLVYDSLKLDLYRRGDEWVALEYRRQEKRYSLYLGRTFEDVQQRAAQDLMRRGLIDHLADLQLQTNGEKGEAIDNILTSLYYSRRFSDSLAAT